MSDELRAASGLPRGVLHELEANPVAAGSELGSELEGAIVLTRWREPDGTERLGVQMHGCMFERALMGATLELVLASLWDGVDERAPGR